MFLLPKGTPLHEDVPAAKILLPDMLAKLKQGGFTGYVRFVFPAASSVLFFESGKLISAKLDQGNGGLSGLEAIAGMCTHIFTGGGSLSVYRLSRDLVMGLHALLHGEMLYRAQELKLIDVKGLLEKLKVQQLNGCLRIYTENRTALIFYKEGSPLGFFHDGAEDIETSASESQKIAGLPGAKIDVLSTKPADELMMYDLLEMVNVGKLWESSQARFNAEREKLRKEAEERENKQRDLILLELEDDLKEIAVAYLGKVARNLVDKELTDRGGRSCLMSESKTTEFLGGIEKAAKLLTSASKIKEMIDTMRSEIAGRI